MDELRGLAERTGTRLRLDVAGDVWAIGDEERIAQIGRALSGNAFVHTPAGTRVTVRVGAGDGKAWIEVEDGGPGIPTEQLERVFDRFYRAEGAVAPGSGLGLAIAKELAELMGGSVRASSRPGRTVFTLELVSTPAPERERRVASRWVDRQFLAAVTVAETHRRESPINHLRHRVST